MKTLKRTTRMSLLTALTLIMILSLGNAAAAAVCVRAAIKTPAVRVRVDSGPRYVRPVNQRVVLPVRQCPVQRLTRLDYAVANRLGRYTGVPGSELLDLRTRGYQWMEIGLWLELPRSAVHAAQDQQTWRSYLNHDRRQTRMATERRHDRGRRHGEIRYLDDRCPR